MKKIILISLIIVLTMTSCQSNNNKNSDNDLTLLAEVIQTITVSEETMRHINNPGWHLYANPENTLIAIIDRSTYQIVLIDFDGNYVTHFGRKGRGPEEFASITSLGWNNGKIVVHDASNNLLKAFDESGQHLANYDLFREQGLVLRGYHILFAQGRWFSGMEKIGGSTNASEMKILASFDINFDFDNSFGKMDSFRIAHNETNPQTIAMDIVDNTLYVNSAFVPYIHRYQIDEDSVVFTGRFGRQTENFNLAEKFLSPMRVPEQRFQQHLREEQSIVSDLYVLNNELIALDFLNHTDDFFETRNPFTSPRYLAIYDRTNNYEYLGELALDYMPVGRTTSGNLILLTSDDPDQMTLQIVQIVK